jgi:hypothetical protein
MSRQIIAILLNRRVFPFSTEYEYEGHGFLKPPFAPTADYAIAEAIDNSRRQPQAYD